MEVLFYPAFNSLTIEDGYSKTVGILLVVLCRVRKLLSLLQIRLGQSLKIFILYELLISITQFYKGTLIAKTATPSDCGAQNEDSLMCYVKTRTSSGSQLNYFHGTSNRSFNTSQDYFPKRSSTAIASTPVLPIGSKVETDREYTDRCMKEGRYTSALCELKANRSLQLLFFQKLQNIDQKLYKVRGILLD